MLLNGTILHGLYKRILQQKSLSLSDDLLSSFFRTLLQLPKVCLCFGDDGKEVSLQLARAFATLHTHINQLPLSLEESVCLFEDLLRELTNGVASDHGRMRLVNVLSLIRWCCAWI